MLSKYEGKVFSNCYSMGQRLNFNQNGSISLCHGIEVGDYIIERKIFWKKLNRKWFEKKIGKIIKKSYLDKNSFCKNCSNYLCQEYHFEGLKVITINTSNCCNCKCIYCTNWASIHRNTCYDPLPYISQLEHDGLINKDCVFDWGGGEPTLNKYFERTVTYLSNKNFFQRVNTNAVVFSEFLYETVCKGKCTIRISLDAGDRATFFNTKGIDGFQDTCNNIRKYAYNNEASICLKYVLTKTNANHKSIEGFLNFCKEINVTNIILDADLNSFSQRNYNGPLFFTKKELDNANYFIDYASEIGLNPQIGYVYTACQNISGRDYNVTNTLDKCIDYKLPVSVPKRKIINSIAPKGIFPKAFASMEAIKTAYGSKIITYEDGLLGKVIAVKLKKSGMCIVNQIKGTMNPTILHKRLDSIDAENIPILLCTLRYNTIVKLFNNNYYLKNEIIAIDSYRIFWGEKLFDLINIILKGAKYTIYNERRNES